MNLLSKSLVVVASVEKGECASVGGMKNSFIVVRVFFNVIWAVEAFSEFCFCSSYSQMSARW